MADILGNDQAPAEAPAQDQTDFAAAFAERTGREEEKPEAQGEEGKEETPAADAEPAKAEPDQSQGANFDPWSGLTDEQKRYFEGVRQSESSNRGRVSALQKKVNAYEAAQQPPAGQDQNRGGDQEAKPGRAEKLKQAAEEYPDAVGDLVEEVVELRTQLEAMKPKAPEAGPEPDAASLEQEYQALEQAHPDYRQIAQDQSYAGWLGSKPKSIQALATSYAAEDVASVLTLFKAERAAAQPNPAPSAGTDTTAQKRQRQLEGSQAVQSRGGPSSSGPAKDDFHAAFAARAKERTR